MAEYEWIVVAGAVTAFIAAFGIGANDVANAFATSVGSKAITIRQACFLAVVFEVSGAVLLGSHVTRTIRKGIADADCFAGQPEVLMFGSLCVIISVACWLLLASYLEMPVSTTHSCVGGMIGMTVVAHGPGCVVWYESATAFPYVKGVGAIVLSWFLSPLLSSAAAAALYTTVRAAVLRAPDSFERAFRVYPLLVGFTVAINAFFMIYKGAKGLGLHKTPLRDAVGVSLGVAAVAALLTLPVGAVIKRRILTNRDLEAGREVARRAEQMEAAAEAAARLATTARSDEVAGPEGAQGDGEAAEARKAASKAAQSPSDARVEAARAEEEVAAIHANAEVFDPRTEDVFRYLQIFTACCDSFGHGANDVANAVGPLAAIVVIYQTGEVSTKVDTGATGYYILLLGGIGIALGLLLYGYKIMAALGVKIAKITPSRGFAIELGAALVIIVGSRMGWPLSTTHCQVGATTGVALLEGTRGVNTAVLVKTAVGWVVTLAVVGCTTAALAAWGLYAPALMRAA